MIINSTDYFNTPNGLILHEGMAIADQPYERVFAIGPNTEAIATAPSAEAVAIGRGTTASARGFGARAISHHDTSRAEASGEGAIAIHMKGNAIAYQGAKAYGVSEL